MQCVIVLVSTHDGVNLPGGDHLSHGGFRTQADCPFIRPQVRRTFVPEVVGSVLHPPKMLYFAMACYGC